MADLTVSASDVVSARPLGDQQAITGEAIDAGESVYIATDGKAYLADCSDTDKDDVVGIAISSAAAGQSVAIQSSHDLTVGGTVSVGTLYVQSSTPGKLCPEADLVTDDAKTVVGIGKTATSLLLWIWNTGLTVS